MTSKYVSWSEHINSDASDAFWREYLGSRSDVSIDYERLWQRALGCSSRNVMKDIVPTGWALLHDYLF